MPRYIVGQAAASRPVRILNAGVPTDWTTILEAPDFSVSDPSVDYPLTRDPASSERRIQPGFSMIVSPILCFNTSGTERWIEFRILSEDGATVTQCRQTVPPNETYVHPASGLRLLKLLLASGAGDRLQVRASVANVITVTGTASEGAAEQHQPEGLA